MWYVSGNRDEEAIENANSFIIDRKHPRQHLSFGFGIHRCVGNRLAEMQLRVVWEEILKRWPDKPIEVVGEPTRVFFKSDQGLLEHAGQNSRLMQNTGTHFRASVTGCRGRGRVAAATCKERACEK